MCLGETILASFFVHFLQLPWMRLSHDYHAGAVWSLSVWNWRRWPWIIFHPVTPGVADLGCLLHSPFDSTGPLMLHDVGSTFGLCLQLHWLELELLVEDGQGVQILARCLFGMWLAALLDQGEHAVLCLVLILWLMLWPECFYGFSGWSCNRWTPHIPNFIEGVFAANVFLFVSHAWFRFHRVRFILTLTPTLTITIIRFSRSGSNFRAWIILVSPTSVVI